LALICAVASLGLSVYSAFFSAEPPAKDEDTKISALQAEIDDLKIQIDSLSARLETASQGEGLKDWSLTLMPRSDGLGASVKLTAVPAHYENGMKAVFLIRLEGAQVAEVPCIWENNTFSAETEVYAADGYGYYCILTDGEGERRQIPLTTPDNPVEEMAVYLETSLNAYCNLLLDGWQADEGKLTLTNMYVQAQLPLLSADENLSIQNTQLVLSHNGQDVQTQTVTLLPGEGERGFEGTLTDISMPLPEMGEEDQLELRLEILLSDGRKLISSAVSWYKNGGELFSVVG
jgi:hypothetical protein